MNRIPVPTWAVQRVTKPTEDLEPPYLFTDFGSLKAFVGLHPISSWSIMTLTDRAELERFLADCLRNRQSEIILNAAATGLGGESLSIEELQKLPVH